MPNRIVLLLNSYIITCEIQLKYKSIVKNNIFTSTIQMQCIHFEKNSLFTFKKMLHLVLSNFLITIAYQGRKKNRQLFLAGRQLTEQTHLLD